jgi:hypothetical protein
VNNFSRGHKDIVPGINSCRNNQRLSLLIITYAFAPYQQFLFINPTHGLLYRRAAHLDVSHGQARKQLLD